MNLYVKRGSRLMRMLLALCVAGILTGIVQPSNAADGVVISEIRIDQPSTDNDEYVELAGPAGTSLDGLTYLVIGDGTGGSGTIEAVIDLSSYNIPASGYFVAAESTFSMGSADLTTSLNFENSDNVTHLLVSGFTGDSGDDLDTDDDGVLDVEPWTAIVDLVALVEEENPPTGTVFHYGPPSVGPDGSYVPGHVFRCGDGWEIGDFDAGITDTPGMANPCLPPVIINEIRIDQSGTDNDEYFELAGPADTSLDGLTYLVIGDGTGGSGVIEAVIDLTGSTIPASGFFVAAEASFTIGAADLTTSINFENSDNVTHLLVSGFTGNSGDDLDTDDDGVLDIEPWAVIVDKIALVEEENPPTGTEFHYGPPSVGPDGAYVPAHVFRCEDGWEIGDFDAGFTDTPGLANDCPGPMGACGDAATLIHAIQGAGETSPLAGTVGVVIEGVVVGDFQDTASGLRGFFLQEEDDDADGHPETSDGVFVFDNGFGVDVAQGDVVRVMGTVTEYYGLTELTGVTGVTVCSAGGTATAAEVTLPIAELADWERYEGMRVHFPQTLYATGNYTQGRYGEVDLSVNGRLDAPTNVTEPGDAAIALRDLNDRSRIQLDDGSTVQNPEPLPPYLGVDNTLRSGDTLPGLTGVLSYSYSAYEVHPTAPVTFTRVNERDALPPSVPGSLKVASFNVLNYFSTLDTGDAICGPSADMDCRGADTPEEFVRQRDKIISAITALDADVVGLMEIENHPTDAALEDLVSGLNDAAGAGTYDYIATGPIGTDAIKVAFIYKPATVTPEGSYAVLDASVDPTFLDTKNRPALAQSFTQIATAETLTVVVNHLKSKGSDCEDVGDPDTGDGQGNCNLTRTAAANAIADWLATDPTTSSDTDFLIIGDLNSYAMEDPITALTDAGYLNLIEAFVGSGAYTYVFYGEKGYLDHALASDKLSPQVSGVATWHINADEPAALDYNDYNQSALFSVDPFRSSDHDPVIVGLDLLTVAMDIKPDSCDNPLNVKSKGNLPVVVLGTEFFDVATIDPATLTLNGVPPLTWAYEDVTEPAVCEKSADGYVDLNLKFDAQEIIAALGSVNDGEILTLTLQGNLKTEYGGRSFSSQDTITILKKGK